MPRIILPVLWSLLVKIVADSVVSETFSLSFVLDLNIRDVLWNDAILVNPLRRVDTSGTSSLVIQLGIRDALGNFPASVNPWDGVDPIYYKYIIFYKVVWISKHSLYDIFLHILTYIKWYHCHCYWCLLPWLEAFHCCYYCSLHLFLHVYYSYIIIILFTLCYYCSYVGFVRILLLFSYLLLVERK